jgi:hypothetical protein
LPSEEFLRSEAQGRLDRQPFPGCALVAGVQAYARLLLIHMPDNHKGMIVIEHTDK